MVMFILENSESEVRGVRDIDVTIQVEETIKATLTNKPGGE